MKKAALVCVSFFVVLTVSVGIVDSISMLTQDINTHAWQTLIGRWQRYEQGQYEIEFTGSGTFVEYFQGVAKSTGSFDISGNTIELFYDEPYCAAREKNSCKKEMEFEFLLDTLILTTQGERSRFKRVKLPDEMMFGSVPNDPAAN